MGRGVEKKAASLTTGKKENWLVQPLWKKYGNFFLKPKIELPYDLAIPHLDIYPKNIKT